MEQWFDCCLVAIEWPTTGKTFGVLELSPRRVNVMQIRRCFKSEEKAQEYIEDQYLSQMNDSIIQVEEDDIQEEIERREQILTRPGKEKE